MGSVVVASVVVMSVLVSVSVSVVVRVGVEVCAHACVGRVGWWCVENLPLRRQQELLRRRAPASGLAGPGLSIICVGNTRMSSRPKTFLRIYAPHWRTRSDVNASCPFTPC